MSLKELSKSFDTNNISSSPSKFDKNQLLFGKKQLKVCHQTRLIFGYKIVWRHLRHQQGQVFESRQRKYKFPCGGENMLIYFTSFESK